MNEQGANHALTVQALRRLLSNVPDHARIGLFTDDSPQGWLVLAGQGFNVRENIFWLRATQNDRSKAEDGSNAEYVRQLEDACLILTAEMPAEQALLIRREVPALADFLGHLHHSIEHEQAMVRRNVWSKQNDRSADSDG
jgi:hypothetical protein